MSVIDRIGNGDPPSAIYVRQVSNLQPSQLGFPNTPDGAAQWDTMTNMLLGFREAGVVTELDNAAREYSWPFDTSTMPLIWPNKKFEEYWDAEENLEIIAADAVLKRVLGDLWNQVDTRSGLPYSQQAKLFYQQADAAVKSAVMKIETALRLADRLGRSEVGSAASSSSVKTQVNWF